MQEAGPQSLGSRPSGSSAPGGQQPGLLMPLGFSLLLTAAARESSMSVLQGAVGLAASTIVVTASVGREVLNLGLFLPAAATRLLPGWGLLFGPTPPAAAPQQPPAPAALQERIRFTLTHGVEPLKAIHQHHRAKQQPAAQPAPWVPALPTMVPPAWASPHHHGASSTTSKAAADALRARHRMAQRMQQGKALFRLPPPAPATAATLVPAGNGWMVSTSAHAQAVASAPAVLSRCASSVASKVAKAAPAPATGARAAKHLVVQRGALASGAVSSEDEEWLPLTHLALRSSLL